MTITIIAIVAAVLAVALFANDPSSPLLRDAKLKLTRALPATATTVTSATAFDTGVTTNDALQPGNIEFLLTAPALNVAQLPNAATMTYNIIGSANSDLSSPVILATSLLAQTGAGGVGAATNTARYRPPSNAPRYIGFTATGVGNGDCSGTNATLELLV